MNKRKPHANALNASEPIVLGHFDLIEDDDELLDVLDLRKRAAADATAAYEKYAKEFL
jgi:hypothetical protein